MTPTLAEMNQVPDRRPYPLGCLLAYDSELTLRGALRQLNALRHAPDWFLDRPVAALGLTTRPANCLAQQDVQTIRQLAAHRGEDIFRWERMGKKSVLELVSRLRLVFRRSLPLDDVVVPPQMAQDAWLAALDRDNPGLAQATREAGITDDESYVRREATLDLNLRRSLGETRMSHLLQSEDRAERISDPLACLGAAPAWLLALPVSTLKLSYRGARVLRESGVQSVRELVPYGRAGLLGIPTMGAGSVREIETRLTALLAHGPDHPDAIDAVHGAPDAWFATLRREAPELAKAAEAAGIVDEETYRSAEASLELDFRHRLGMIRFRHYAMADPTPDNVVAHLRHAPQWVMDLPVSRLGLEFRAQSALHRSGVFTVSQLAAYDAPVLAIPRLGVVSYADLCERLARLIASGPDHHDIRRFLTAAGAARPGTSLPQEQSQPLTEQIRRSFDSLPLHVSTFLRMRIGHEREPVALVAAAAAIGMSLDEARKIEEGAPAVFRLDLAWVRELEARLRDCLENQCTPLTADALAQTDPWFAGAQDVVAVIRFAAERWCSGSVTVLRIANREYITPLDGRTWNRALDRAKELVRIEASNFPLKDDLSARIAALLPSEGRHMATVLVDVAFHYANFAEVPLMEPGERLVSVGHDTPARITAILMASPVALHEQEIRNRLSRTFGTGATRQHVTAICTEIGVLLGRRTYGLVAHIPLNGEERARVADIALEIAADGRQIQTLEVAIELQRRGLDKDGAVDKYMVQAVLTADGRLTNLGRMVWRSKCADDAGHAERLHLQTAVAEILAANGAPMHGAQLRSRLAERRSMASTFQIFSNERVVRLGPNYWGLVDRDLPFDRHQVAELLAAALGCRGKGLHVSEIATAIWASAPAAIRQADPQILTAAARLDPRFRFDRGDYVYLAEWGGSGRHNPHEVVRSLVKGMPPVARTIQHWRADVERVMERRLPSSILQNALRGAGLRYNPSVGGWVPQEHGSTAA